MIAFEKIEIEINDKFYNIFTIKIFYFVFYFDFQCHFEQMFKKHDNISFFQEIYQSVERNFRNCFRILKNSNVIVYYILCDILNFFCIDTFDDRFVDVVIKNFKSNKKHYDVNYKKSFFVKNNKTITKDNCFRFLYFISKTKFENDTKTFQQIYQTIIFVIFYRVIFKYRVRKTIKAIMKTNFLCRKNK